MTAKIFETFLVHVPTATVFSHTPFQDATPTTLFATVTAIAKATASFSDKDLESWGNSGQYYLEHFACEFFEAVLCWIAILFLTFVSITLILAAFCLLSALVYLIGLGIWEFIVTWMKDDSKPKESEEIAEQRARDIASLHDARLRTKARQEQETDQKRGNPETICNSITRPSETEKEPKTDVGGDWKAGSCSETSSNETTWDSSEATSMKGSGWSLLPDNEETIDPSDRQLEW